MLDGTFEIYMVYQYSVKGLIVVYVAETEGSQECFSNMYRIDAVWVMTGICKCRRHYCTEADELLRASAANLYPSIYCIRSNISLGTKRYCLEKYAHRELLLYYPHILQEG